MDIEALVAIRNTTRRLKLLSAGPDRNRLRRAAGRHVHVETLKRKQAISRTVLRVLVCKEMIGHPQFLLVW